MPSRGLASGQTRSANVPASCGNGPTDRATFHRGRVSGNHPPDPRSVTQRTRLAHPCPPWVATSLSASLFDERSREGDRTVACGEVAPSSGTRRETLRCSDEASLSQLSKAKIRVFRDFVNPVAQLFSKTDRTYRTNLIVFYDYLISSFLSPRRPGDVVDRAD